MSQPNQPRSLNPQEQDTLVKQIGLTLIRSAPQEWQEIKAEFRAIGRYYELRAEFAGQDGISQPWTPSQELALLFAQLRAGMHGERGGTWFNARYAVQRPSAYNLEFDRVEPHWRTPPPPVAYRDELHFFPRRDEDVPEWLAHRLAALPPERPGPRFRVARIFDAPGPDGRPTVNRPMLSDEERSLVLGYLDRAAMILPLRGHDIDRLAPEAKQVVPVAFQSDGIWIWPAAVNYYLRNYGLPPEPALVEHARTVDFIPSEIDEQTKTAAAAHITGGRPPVLPLPRTAAGHPDAGSGIPAPAIRASQPVPRTGRPTEPELALESLRAKLCELGVPDATYRIGGPAADSSWHVDEADGGWKVAWSGRNPSVPVLFEDPSDAAAFLLGKVLLNSEDSPLRHGSEPVSVVEPEPVEMALPNGHRPAAESDDRYAPAGGHNGVDIRPTEYADDRRAQGGIGQTEPETVEPESVQAGHPGTMWPIQPLHGEPPLTLFHDKRMVQLPAGTELDRYGDEEGNLTYTAGTPFDARSLPAEWEHRPYHVYQLKRPLEVLAGEAIPWFDQPGGGQAVLLPHSVATLLDQGELVEVVHEGHPL